MRCDECGFEYGSVQTEQVVPTLQDLAARYGVVLTERDDTALRRRPSPDVWSALEYACHVRDVLLVMRERVLQALREETPAFTPMGRDERVVHDRYDEQSPADVARQLEDAAAMLTFLWEGLDDEQWARTCVYNYPAPAERTLSWVAQQTIHEADHHLRDIEASLAVT